MAEEQDNIDQKDDPEVTDTTMEELDRIRDKFMPYQRQIMIVGLLILIFLVVFLGFAFGGVKVCQDLDGVLDSEFKCHPNYKPEQQQRNIDRVGATFVVPNISIEK